jgi:hypothetical protein
VGEEAGFLNRKHLGPTEDRPYLGLSHKKCRAVAALHVVQFAGLAGRGATD